MNSLNSELALAPLGAGDLIDRAVRLYRRHFLTLIGIAAPPVVLSALGSTITTISWRELTATSSEINMALYVLMLMAGIVIIISGALFSIIVMGGATRTLVAHLLWNEPVTARATYRAVKSRFWGLLGASMLVALWLAFATLVAFSGSSVIFMVMAFGIAFATMISGWLAGILWGIGMLVAIVAASILFFFLAGRMAYVPQLLSCQRQRSPFDGDDIVHVFWYLLCSDAVDDSAGMVRLSQRCRSVAFRQYLADLVFDWIPGDSAMQSHSARADLDAGVFAALR